VQELMYLNVEYWQKLMEFYSSVYIDAGRVANPGSITITTGAIAGTTQTARTWKVSKTRNMTLCRMTQSRKTG